MAGPCHAFRARCGGDGRRWSGGRELPAPHRRLDPRREAAAAVARPPLLYRAVLGAGGVNPVRLKSPEPDVKCKRQSNGVTDYD